MIDKAVFLSVFSDFDADVINQIIDIYVNEHPQKFSTMKKSLETMDFPTIRSIAHGLKGVLSQLFATQARQQSSDLEVLAKQFEEYYKERPGAKFDPTHQKMMSEMIESLRISSIKVIESLKEIQKSYN